MTPESPCSPEQLVETPNSWMHVCVIVWVRSCCMTFFLHAPPPPPRPCTPYLYISSVVQKSLMHTFRIPVRLQQLSPTTSRHCQIGRACFDFRSMPIQNQIIVCVFQLVATDTHPDVYLCCYFTLLTPSFIVEIYDFTLCTLSKLGKAALCFL